MPIVDMLTLKPGSNRQQVYKLTLVDLNPAGSLRANAQLLLLKGDVSAIREIADRLDGRVPQAIVGDDESDPIRYAISDEPMDPDEWARKHQTSD